MPIYGQYKLPVKSVGGAFSDVSMRRRRTEAAGRKKAPDGSFIDFSAPSVPSYDKPITGSSSVSLDYAQSNRRIGNTATMHRPEAFIPPRNSTTKIREQNYPTNPLMTTGPLQTAYYDTVSTDTRYTRPAVMDNLAQTNATTMHRPEAFIPPRTSTTKIREKKYSTNPLITTGPLQTAYDTVSTDTCYTRPDVTDNLAQTFNTLGIRPSFASDNWSFANIASNAGPAPWIGSDLKKPHPSDLTKPQIILQATETVESTKHASDEAKVKQTQDAKALQDTFIPSTIPEEIQAIIDSYLSGRPLLLVISNNRFFDYWSLRLPKEFRFFMLGYFRILGVQVLPSSNPLI